MSGLITLEKKSSNEWLFNKYKDYKNLINPQFSVKFEAPVLKLYECITTKDDGFIISGIFRGTLEFADNLALSKGNHELFLMKLDSNFRRIWFKVMSCTSEIENISLFDTANGSTLIGGSFSGQLFKDSQNWISQGEKDNFLWYLDLHGNSLWFKTFGGFAMIK